MLSKLPRFIVFLFTCVLVLREWIDVLIKNATNTDDRLTYVLPDSIEVAAIALGIVGLSIFLKRNIWAYLFLLVLITSFFPVLAFSDFSMAFYIGSLKLDLIAITLLVVHILLNIHLIKIPELSKEEAEETHLEKVEQFTKRFSTKSDADLLRMDESDLLPEAIEARRKLLSERGL